MADNTESEDKTEAKDTKNYWKVDSRVVEHVAKLARLELTDEEKKKFTKQLADVLGAFEKINEVDTEGVEPAFHPQELKNDWRDDEVKKWDWRPVEPLSNTKHKEDKFFKGPKIV